MYAKIFHVVGVQNHSFESTEEEKIPYQTIAFMPDLQVLKGGIGIDAFTGSTSTIVVMSPELVENLGDRVNLEEEKIDDSILTLEGDPHIRYSRGFRLRGDTIVGVLHPSVIPLEQEGEGFVIPINEISEEEK